MEKERKSSIEGSLQRVNLCICDPPHAVDMSSMVITINFQIFFI